MAQRIRRETTNLEIAGSNPAGNVFLFFIYSAFFIYLARWPFYLFRLLFIYLFYLIWSYGVIGYHSGL